MSDIQIQKAQCLCDLTDALPHYRKQLDRIDERLTNYIADAISDQAAHANIYEQLTKDGKHIAYYDGIVDASIATGAPRELIGKVCHGRKKTAGGYRWKFKEQ